MRFVLSLQLLLVFPLWALAQRDAKIPDPDPEIERKTFILPEGFEVNLWAADPLLAKPIQMNWDAQGRLWLATSETYPQIEPGKKANDKIVILEDTKGQGKADKVTVFADGLLIPTGIEPDSKGGCYVAASTELLHFSKSQPDLPKADIRKVVLSGFGTEDTHHILHTLRWGPDGKLYMNQSVYIHSHIETPYGPRRLNGGGIWQYDTETGRLEVFARGFWNPWGHAFDKYGQSFATDGANGEGIVHVIPGAYYPTGNHVGPRLLHGMNPGSPKHCGLEIISGRQFPDDWQGDMITNDFRGHRVCRFKLSENGSTFASKEMTEVIKSNHPAFRPIDLKMGPDGALYIADWYNPIIQHGEVDFRDPRRDHTHGRIWRVTAKGRPLVKKKDPITEPDNRTWALRKMSQKFLENPPSPSQSQNFAEEISSRDINDPNPKIRLEAIRTLARLTSPEAVAAALKALDHPMDPTLDYALWLTVRDLEPIWLPAFLEGKLTFNNNPKHLAFALQAINSASTLPALVKMIESSRLPQEQSLGMWKLLADLGGPQEQIRVLNRALNSETNVKIRQELLNSLIDNSQRRKLWNGRTSNALIDKILLDDKTPEDLKISIIRLAGLWKHQSLQNHIHNLLAGGANPSPTFQRAAVQALVDLGTGEAKQEIELQTNAVDHPSTRAAAIAALAQFDEAKAAVKAVEVMKEELSKIEPADLQKLVEAFLNRKTGPAVLANALKGATIKPDAAKMALRSVRASGKELPALLAAINDAGKLANLKPDYSTEAVKKMVSLALEKGEAARGEAIYRRKEMQCLNCHAINGVGGAVGPDMGSIGASAQMDYLVESLWLPSKAIKEGFHSVLINTENGNSVTGIPVREANGELILRTAEDKILIIPVRDIAERKQAKSLMPEGLVDTLTTQEQADLVRFLSELGKVGPYAPQKTPIVRRWQTLEPTPNTMSFIRQKRLMAALEKDAPVSWVSAYAEVGGKLPLSEIPSFAVWGGSDPQSVLRTQISVTTPGKIDLKLGSLVGVEVWVNGKVVDLKAKSTLELPKGESEIALVINRNQCKEPIAMELNEAKENPAKFSLLLGK